MKYKLTYTEQIRSLEEEINVLTEALIKAQVSIENETERYHYQLDVLNEILYLESKIKELKNLMKLKLSNTELAKLIYKLPVYEGDNVRFTNAINYNLLLRVNEQKSK